MKRLVMLLAILVVLGPATGWAQFTETLPKGMFMIDETYYYSTLSHAYDNDGDLRPIFDEIERYEPGGGKQGVITPNVDVTFQVLVNQLQYGITDYLSIGVGVPVVLDTTIITDLGWTPGDYQTWLGHPYTGDEFWQWASSMGQPKPGSWSRGSAVLSDILVGVVYRFSDHIPWFAKVGLPVAFTVMAAFPTGEQADPEQIVAAGTTAWDLHSQGELCLHLSIDKTFKESLNDRLTIGLDLFYEALWKHEYTTGTGSENPLLLNYAPYVGDTYTIDPGDFSGGAVKITVVPLKGPAFGTWLSKNDVKKAEKLPPLVSLSFMYKHVHLAQSDWESDSELWDWNQEKTWRPGYKNILEAKLLVSLFRFGIPVQLYASYKDQNLIGGKNCRAANVLAVGLRIPLQFW